MQIFNEIANVNSIGILNEMPMAIEIHQDAPGIAHFYNGDSCHIGCLGCLNPRCMSFSEEEIECNYIEGFPYDRNTNVCPVEAISWNTTSAVPEINPTNCMSCGICVSRCPVGALYFTSDGEVRVATSDTQYVEFKESNDTNQSIHNTQTAQLSELPRAGVALNVSDQIIEGIYEKLFRLRNNYHNSVGRNLLIALGCKCSTRRIGDVYTRMDAVYLSNGGSFGAVEIEFGRDTLDASRAILDDIAVLNTRYGVNKNNDRAIVICLQLPNARQGYWQVVKDIKEVENIKIGTITIGALMFLLWNGCKLEPEGDLYYIDYDDMDLRQKLCYQVDCDNIPISNKKLGILEPEK